MAMWVHNARAGYFVQLISYAAIWIKHIGGTPCGSTTTCVIEYRLDGGIACPASIATGTKSVACGIALIYLILGVVDGGTHGIMAERLMRSRHEFKFENELQGGNPSSYSLINATHLFDP